MKAKHLIADTAAFVKNVPLWEYGETLYSLPEVIGEIRDKNTLQHIQSFPVKINLKDPKPESIRFINEFSKKTGDFASLSLADVKVMALTYELEVEQHEGDGHLRSEPEKRILECPGVKTRQGIPNLAGFYYPKEQGGDKTQQSNSELPSKLDSLSLSEEEGKAEENGGEESEEEEDNTVEDEESSEGEEGEEPLNGDGEHLWDGEGEEEEDADDEEEDEEEEEEAGGGDDDGWITPSNVKKIKKKAFKGLIPNPEEEQKEVLVACMTSDFAMQNVMKHIRLRVLGVDGKLIHQIRTYILRCHACFKTTTYMNKKFCPKCGNKTLKKVSITVNPDGTSKIWINTKKRINTRGTKFPLPMPRGGKHERYPILSADQKQAQKAGSKMFKKKINPLHEDYDAMERPFAIRDVYSRASQLGYRSGKKTTQMYWERKNPNEVKKTATKNKRK